MMMAAFLYLGAGKTSTYYAIAPFVGAGLSLLIFWEKPSGLYLAALVIMIFGTYFTATDGQQPEHKQKKNKKS
ncbi:MAG: hypothetical protein ACI4GO_00960 [Hominenteromicrobium sp.]